MRRRSDSWINATQLLKVAGVNKGQRTKILDKDIAAAGKIPYEKIQGGYGRYQGTWIPFHEAIKLAEQYNILSLIQPLMDYQPAPPLPPLAGLGQKSPRAVQPAVPLAVPPAQSTPTNTLPPLPPQSTSNPSQPTQSILTPRANGIAAPSQPPKDDQPIPSPRKRSRASTSTPNGKSSANADSADDSRPTTNGKRPRRAAAQSNSSSRSEVTQEIPSSSLQPDASASTSSSSSIPAPPSADPSIPLDIPLPTRMQRSKKMTPPITINNEHRNLLMTLFVTPDHDAPPASPSAQQQSHQDDSATTTLDKFPPDLDPNSPIDEQQHTALHWAAALARVPVVQSLIGLGADVHRGNAAGETPLMRAVLVTNNADSETFAPPGLLSPLLPSLRTVDDADRTVLHHIATVAGIKGRAASARHYMECILHVLAERETSPNESGNLRPEYREFLDAQDVNGDTALNIAARVGSRFIVRMLVESGANTKLPNKLGLRPGDFGMREEGLALPTPEELAVEELARTSSSTAVTSMKLSKSSSSQPHSHQTGDGAGQSKPSSSAQLSADIVAFLQTTLATLAEDFAAELQARSESLARTRQQLRAASKDLADQRLVVANLRDKVRQVELSKWRIRNLERALVEEDSFDWTGRSTVDGTPAFESPSSSSAAQTDQQDAIRQAAFEWRGPACSMLSLNVNDMPKEIEADAPILNSSKDADGKIKLVSSTVTLAELRRLCLWYERVLDLLRTRTERIQQSSGGEIELDARRVVKLCIGLESLEQVDEMVDQLITALESDGQDGPGGGGLDLQRVSNFMARVRTQEVA